MSQVRSPVAASFGNRQLIRCVGAYVPPLLSHSGSFLYVIAHIAGKQSLKAREKTDCQYIQVCPHKTGCGETEGGTGDRTPELHKVNLPNVTD